MEATGSCIEAESSIGSNTVQRSERPKRSSEQHEHKSGNALAQVDLDRTRHFHVSTAMGSAASKVTKVKPIPKMPQAPVMPTARAPKPEPMPAVSEAKSEGESFWKAFAVLQELTAVLQAS